MKIIGAHRLGIIGIIGLSVSSFPQQADAIINISCSYSSYGWTDSSGTVQVRGVETCTYIDDSYTGGGGGYRSNGNDNVGGGGGSNNRNPGAREQPTQDASTGDKPCDGNPVIRSTGNKVEPELDFASGGEMGLYLQRTYNSYWSGVGIFGNYWISNFDYSLAASVASGVQTLWVQYPDGRRIKFIHSAATGRYLEEKPQPVAYAVKNGDGSYTVRDEDGDTQRYSAAGQVTELRKVTGVAWTFAYTGQYLTSVTHTSGRQIRFIWNNAQLVQVVDPAGNAYNYTYTPNVFGTSRGRLATATLPGIPTTTISYHYEDARYLGGLTGKSFNGIRYSRFAYDANARAISTEHVGNVEKFSFEYTVAATTPVEPPPAPVPPGGYQDDNDRGWCEYQPGAGRICYQPRLVSDPGSPNSANLVMTYDGTEGVTASQAAATPSDMTVTVTNPLGKRTSYRYVNDRLMSTTGASSANCPSSYKEGTYDTNGYPDLTANFEDGLTDTDHDAAGRLLKKVEAPGKAITRTTTYGWDTTNNRMLRETVAGHHETTYTYRTDGRLETRTVKNLSGAGVANQQRTTTYTYALHPNGMLASVTEDGPLAGVGDAIVTSYDQYGNLTSRSNSLQHVITYSDFNGLGQPRKVVSENGAETTYEYDARGRITKKIPFRNGEGQVTSYKYDGFGRLASVTDPDGQAHAYQYDVAGRLVLEQEPDADGGLSEIAYSYNANSQPVSIRTQRGFSVIQGGTQP